MMSDDRRTKHLTTSESWLDALQDVYKGTVIGTWYNMYIVNMFIEKLLIRPSKFVLGIEETKVITRSPTTLQVIGVGYGRTGTFSLCVALDELGFPCLHTQHLYANEKILEMWIEDVVQPSLREGTASLHHPNLELIAEQGYAATADFPMALYYEQILEKFPDCKFILTTRETSQTWYRSWEILQQNLQKPQQLGNLIPFLPFFCNYMQYLRWLFAIVDKDDSFLIKGLHNDHYSDPMSLNSHRDTVISSYEQHNQRVREVIPSQQLLEYNVVDGWEPLCNFLEIKPDFCPTDIPFPKTNSARELQTHSTVAIAYFVAVVCFIIFYLFTQVFQALTGKKIIPWFRWKIRVFQAWLLKGKNL